MHIEHRTLHGRDCTFYIPDGPGPFPVVLLCTGDADALVPQLMTPERPPVLYVHVDADWSRDYTPWPAPALRGREAFAGGAGEYLPFLTDDLLPILRADYPVHADAAHTAIAGYSLGGLFALWAITQSRAFGAAASLSGSLWYDGWEAYRDSVTLPSDACVYLSLGRSEERAGDPRMAAVGDCTRRTHDWLRAQLGDTQTALDWNRGGHFTGIPNRWNKAIDWLTAAWR